MRLTVHLYTAKDNITKRESLSVQKTPVHRTGERAVLKERTCKRREKRFCGCAKEKLVPAAALVTSRETSSKRQPFKEFRPLRRATRA